MRFAGVTYMDMVLMKDIKKLVVVEEKDIKKVDIINYYYFGLLSLDCN